MFIPFGTADGICTPQRIFPAQMPCAAFFSRRKCRAPHSWSPDLEYRMSRARHPGVQSFGELYSVGTRARELSCSGESSRADADIAGQSTGSKRSGEMATLRNVLRIVAAPGSLPQPRTLSDLAISERPLQSPTLK